MGISSSTKVAGTGHYKITKNTSQVSVRSQLRRPGSAATRGGCLSFIRGTFSLTRVFKLTDCGFWFILGFGEFSIKVPLFCVWVSVQVSVDLCLYGGPRAFLFLTVFINKGWKLATAPHSCGPPIRHQYINQDHIHHCKLVLFWTFPRASEHVF